MQKWNSWTRVTHKEHVSHSRQYCRLDGKRDGKRQEGNVFMELEIEDKTDLLLDTDSVRDRVGVRSSLTDINQINVFSDIFIKKKETVEKERQAAKEKLYGTVFVETLGNEAETEITDLIFLDNTEELLIRNEQEIVESQPWPLLWILPVTIIMFAAALLYKTNRKGKKKYDADNQPEAVA